ncbi:DUF4272 domain-containing protein [Prosthecobacter vanneervenii]|uniref:DUF4272 domain-containing protein n=1 Tax=Prosthecobacter vanneervenii TaxID=48466 RepID=A0A7W8DLT3_9BACT|nr:DUF4272 domain-containing protein [Prosthecobacter vanneervenii]MBB5034161.1 hypothetical protein [Prosthecobacter vanneervenii]
MPPPPINIFSQHRKPEEVLQLLRQQIPEAIVETSEDGVWSCVRGTWKRGWMKGALHMEVRHDPDYYAGEGWDAQLAGMAGYFRQFPGASQRPELFGYLPGLAFAVNFIIDPAFTENDPRQEVIASVTRLLDGVIFLPGCLSDAEGRLIISADDDADPEAQLPAHEPAQNEDAEPSDEPSDCNPPTESRVISRLTFMGALVNRGFMEDHPEGEALRLEMLDGFRDSDAWQEGEEDEIAALETPVGELPENKSWELPWLSEGAAVLAWSLGLMELPAYDEQVETDDLYKVIGDLENQRLTPKLRSPEELEKLSSQMLCIHWRLRQFSIEPKSMDFAEFAPRAWWGAMDLSLARLSNNDLEIQGAPLIESSEEDWKCTSGIMEERRKAIHWLLGQNPVYSENDTST